jgi:hypothetical protein
MSTGSKLTVLILAGSAIVGHSQTTKSEVWPEVDIYVNADPRTRVVFVDSFNQDQQSRNTQGSFTYFFDFALSPIFRRELRQREDVFRRRFLTFRAGYQYSTSFVGDDSSSEHRAIAESTARYPILWKFVVTDRNRAEFRFIKGEPFSMRYRNRLWIERDLRVRRLVCTPYTYVEAFYDTRYDAWTTVRYTVGVEFPAGPHIVVQPYFVRQNDRRSTPQHVNAFGLTWNLYF